MPRTIRDLVDFDPSLKVENASNMAISKQICGSLYWRVTDAIRTPVDAAVYDLMGSLVRGALRSRSVRIKDHGKYPSK